MKRFEEEQGVLRCYYDIEKEWDLSVTVCDNPLSNCQTYSIGGIQDLINDFDFNKDLILKELKEIQKKVSKNQILIDVNSIDENDDGSNDNVYPEIIESIFSKEYIIFKNEYTNGTGSEMIMYLINTHDLK